MTIQLFVTDQGVIVGKPKKSKQQESMERTHMLGQQVYEVSDTGAAIAVQARDNYRAILTEHAEVILSVDDIHTSVVAEAEKYILSNLVEFVKGIGQVEEVYLADNSTGLMLAIVFSEYNFEVEHKLSNFIASLEMKFVDVNIDVDVYYLEDFEEEDIEGFERIYAKGR